MRLKVHAHKTVQGSRPTFVQLGSAYSHFTSWCILISQYVIIFYATEQKKARGKKKIEERRSGLNIAVERDKEDGSQVAGLNFAVERDKEEGSQVAGLNFTVERDKEEGSQVAWILLLKEIKKKEVK